ncbi:MAG: ISAs1 family transposase [Cyanobacteria bacterium CRU_2_1]|nr:ISAs1 family transposase [Cyanobacteria bacterium CRU_2_1]
MSLITHLKPIPDFRTQPRYPLWVILLLVIMGTMSGCQGYRSLEDFVQRHQQVLLKVLELPYQRLPSFSTLRRIMVRVDFAALTVAFNAWASETFPTVLSEQIATDGKGIKASVIDYDNCYQDFINIVSAFSVTQGVVVALAPMRNGHTSEIATVQTLLSHLQLSGVCFSMDALHTQKNSAADCLKRQ